jgi:E1A/CREB-binding protein
MQKRKFEPSVLYCQGQCGMQRIKRHAAYYTDRAKANHWCQTCYNQLVPDKAIVLDDGSEINKKDLQCFNNDALPEEAWVHCDECQSWVHQICALFNGRINKSNAKFTCPSCHLKKESVSPLSPLDKDFVKGADQLPHCKMSISIESGLLAALQNAYEQKARDLGISVDSIEKASGLSVRVVSNVEKQHFVGDEVCECVCVCSCSEFCRYCYCHCC